jgi:cell wall-associated NlpC family hydrolase
MTRRDRKRLLAAAAAGLVLAGLAHRTAASTPPAARTPHVAVAAARGGQRPPSHAAAVAIAYARAQLGKPYHWADTGPYEFDCSGLVMRAYEAAGVWGIPRTSQAQWVWGAADPRGPGGARRPGVFRRR